MNFTRRHWGREAVDIVRWPFSMLEGKHSRDRRFSLFRVILLICVVAFVKHWPGTWDVWSWAALATIVLAAPVADLFAAAPVKEALAALTAICADVAAKRTGAT